MKPKISIVFADGKIESIFTTNHDIDIEILDFDSADENEQEELGDIVDKLRDNPNIKELVDIPRVCSKSDLETDDDDNDSNK